MFEQPKISKKLKQQLSKVLSIALSVAMLAGSIPADMLGGIASVKAATGKTLTLAASSLSESGENATISGDKGTDDAFNVSNVILKKEGTENVTWYLQLTNPTSPEDSPKSSITFTISGLEDNKKVTLSADAYSNSDVTKLNVAKTGGSSQALSDGGKAELENGEYKLTAAADETVNITLLTLQYPDTEDVVTPPPTDTVDTTVNVAVDGKVYADSYTVTLTENGASGNPDTLTISSTDITDGNYTSSAKKLKKKTKYDVSCDSPAITVAVAVGEEDDATASNDKEKGDISVTTGEAACTVTITLSAAEVTPEVSITDEDDLLKTANKTLKLVSAEEDETEDEGIELTVKDAPGEDNKVTLIVGKKYKIAETTIPDGATAKIKDAVDGVLTVTSELETLEVTVESSQSSNTGINATITINDGNVDLTEDESYTITLKPQTGAEVKISSKDIGTGGKIDSPYQLEPETKYDITVKIDEAEEQPAPEIKAAAAEDAKAIKATVDKKRSVTTTATDMNITLNVATQKEATIKFEGDKLPEDADITLTNNSDEDDDVVVLAEEGTAKEKAVLWIGDVYKLEADSEADLTATIGDKDTFTAAKNTSSITVKIEVEEEEDDDAEPVKYVLDVAKDLEVAKAGKYPATFERVSAGTVKENGEKYFTLIADEKTRIEDVSDKETYPDTDGHPVFNDGYEGTRRINPDGKAQKKSRVVEFTTTQKTALVKVWWVCAGDNRNMYVYKDDSFSKTNALYDASKDTAKKSEFHILTVTLNAAGTYYVGSADGTNHIYKVEVVEGAPATYALDVSKDLEAAEAGTYPATFERVEAGSEKDGKKYFTLIADEKTRIEDVEDTETYRDTNGHPVFDDGYEGTRRINPDGKAQKKSRVVEFTTTKAEATVKVWWVCAGDNRNMYVYKDDSFSKANALYDASKDTAKKSEPYILTVKLDAAGTYYVGSADGTNHIYKIEVAEGKSLPEDPRGPWIDVADPTVEIDETNTKPENIVVIVNGVKGTDGGDSVSAIMTKADDDTFTAVTKKSVRIASKHKLTFTPTSTGTYKFTAKISRSGEQDKVSQGDPLSVDFILPIANVTLNSVSNVGKDSSGKGQVKLSWNAVAEADLYEITATETENESAAPVTLTYTPTETDGATLQTLMGGLTLNTAYTFAIKARRAEINDDKIDISQKASTAELTVKGIQEIEWGFTAYGESTSPDKEAKNGYSGNANDGSVQVWSLDNAGKIVPASTDGLSFYYTKVPVDENFKLTATLHADQWTYTNGQDGFGLIATDRLGTGTTQFWNNSYMLGFTKVEYNWLEGQVTSSADGAKINMHIGPGALEKTGVTKENLANFTQNSADGTITMTQSEAISKWFNTGTTPLDTSMADYGAGDYNIVANHKSVKGLWEDPAVAISTNRNDFVVTLEKNNTGYFLSYVTQTGKTVTKKFYDPTALEHLDEDSVYVGFFTGRNAKVTFKDIEFSTSIAANDPPAEAQPVTYYVPSYSVTSATVANTRDYEFKFSSNWAGNLTVKDAAGNAIIDNFKIPSAGTVADPTAANPDNTKKVIFAPSTFKLPYIDTENKVIYADSDYKLSTEETEEGYELVTGEITTTISNKTCGGKDITLNVGDNTYTVLFKPDKSYYPNNDVLNQLKDYSTSNFTHTVNYKAYGEVGQKLYVAPDGKASGTGTKNNPLDIYTAIKYVQAGQSIILMAEKDNYVYSLSKTVRIERGINGTADKMIYLMAAPEATKAGIRPVLDFNGASSGIVHGGDYWYMQGFDVMRAKDGQKGIQVSGSHNILENLHTYLNGNTGIQIARLYGSDTFNDWPAYNIVRNCDSYMNADSGFEDADGFAAKLTVGNGNEFHGCVAAYNADDGWDLFAKAESGPIGKVKLFDCVTYKNGYVLVDENGKLSLTGTKEQDAGNGNGFKLGGESLSGFHELHNSYAFFNKAKGIDSNSCPDIQVYNSVSFNNESYNIAFYTNTATQTNFGGYGVISYKTPELLESSTEEHKIQNIEDIVPVGLQTYQAWLIANARGGKILDERLITAYKAIASDKLSKFKGTGKWADLSDSAYDAFKAAADTVGLSDIDKEICVKYMPAIVEFNGKTQAEKDALIAELGKENNNYIWGWNNYYIFADKTVNPLTGTEVDKSWFKNITVSDDVETNLAFWTDKCTKPVVSRNETYGLQINNDFLQLTEDAKNKMQKDAENGIVASGNWGLTPEPSKDLENDPDAPKFDTEGEVVGGVGTEDTSGVVPGDEPVNTEDNQMTGLWFAFVDMPEGGYTYTGTAIRPEIRVYHETTRLTSKDYSVSYLNTVNAYVSAEADKKDESGKVIYDSRRAPTIRITGKGNFEGFINQTFDINPVNIDEESGLVAAPTITKIKTSSSYKEKVVPTLTYNGRNLSKTKDFKLTWNSEYDYTKPGKHAITVTGTGNYKGTRDVYLNIVDKNDTSMIDINKAKITQKSSSIVLLTPSYVYCGEEIKPEISVIYTDPKTRLQRKLDEGTEYTVTYSNNVNVGTATIVVEGTGEKASEAEDAIGFYGSKTLKFKITAANVRNLYVKSEKYAIAASRATEYAGQPIVFPDLELIMLSHNGNGYANNGDGVTLKESRDYTISYSGNSKAGLASFTIKGKGNYTGVLRKTFKITAYNIERDEKGLIDVNTESEVVYAAGGAKPFVSVALKDKNGTSITLTQGKDYTVSYRNNMRPTTITATTRKANIIIIGKNGFTGKITKEFTITKKDMGDTYQPLTMEASDVEAKTRGAAPRTIVRITTYDNKVVPASEYTLKYYVYEDTEEGVKKVEKTNVRSFQPSAGDTIYVEATAKPNSKNYTGSIETTYRVTGYDIRRARVKAFDPKYYTGDAVTLSDADYEYYDIRTNKYVSRITCNVKVNGKTQTKELVYGTDFEVVPGSYVNNTKAGVARLTIRGITYEFGGTKIITFRINKKCVNVSRAVYGVDEDYDESLEDYAGADLGKVSEDVVKKYLVIKLNNFALTEGVDYTIDFTKYSKNQTVTIIGKGNYGGTKTIKLNSNLVKLSRH